MKIVGMYCGTTVEIYKDHKEGDRQSILENQMMLDLKKMQAGDYRLQNFALYVNLEQTRRRPFEFHIEFLDTSYQEMKAHEDTIRIVRSYEDINRNWEQGRMSALLTMEEGGTCQGKTVFLRNFYRLGMRMMTLTWNFPDELASLNTRIAEGNGTLRIAPDTEHGFTDIRIAFMEGMERLGMIIDISHLNDANIWNALQYTRNSLVASCPNVRTVASHPRDLTDGMVRVLAGRDGVMGINYCTAFLRDFGPGEEQLSRISDMVGHMKYIRKIGGIDCIGLGSDFDGIGGNLETGDAGKLPTLTHAMERGSSTSSEIEAVFCKNVLRIYEGVLQREELYISLILPRGGFYFSLICCLHRLHARKGGSQKTEQTYITEDDENIMNLLKIALGGFEYVAEGFETAKESLTRMREEEPDLVTFDWMLPGMDGTRAIKGVRNTEQLKYMPAMFLTVKEKEFDRAVRLDCGTDNYMVKPSGVLELSARIRSLLRKAKREKDRDVLPYWGTQVNRRTREMSSGGWLVELTLKELELLVYLLENQPRVVTRDELLNRIWSHEYNGKTKALNIHIRALRQKLGEEGGACVKTIQGVGYCTVR